MADEIDLSIRLALRENAAATALKIIKEIPRGRQRIDQTTARLMSNVQNVGTTHEALVMGDVATAGVGFFLNLSATNYVEVGVDSAGTFIPVVKLKAGEAYVFRLATNAPYARANTAAVELDYLILAD